MEKDTPFNPTKKKVTMVTLMSEKVDFRTRNITQDKEGEYITKTGSIFPEGIIILNMNVPHSKTTKYMKQTQSERKEKEEINP